MGNEQLHDPDVERQAAQPPEPQTAAAMDELRRLLVGQEQERIDSIETELRDRKISPLEVSQVLPDAIDLRERADDRVARAMSPVIEDGIKNSVRRNPDTIAEAIFPVLGPAIRKSIADTFSRLIQSFNQTLEHSMSWRSLKWRLEARRTGRSFSEVVLLHTLIYRVEQVFLIHSESGLLLQHAAAPSAPVQDSELVSGMLTAIQDFAHDSFSVEDGEGLQSFQLGELTVWIERGPQAMLAAVIRGIPPSELRSQLQSAIEHIHRDQVDALESFDGETDTMQGSLRYLETCLAQASQEQEKKPRFYFAWAALGLVALALVLWMFFGWRGHVRWKNAVARLQAEPGVVVIESGEADGRYFVTGLRDPLSSDPAVVLRSAGMEPEEIETRWEPYVSVEAELVKRRLQTLLAPPEGVELLLENGVLVARGRVKSAWKERMKTVATSVPGVQALRADALEVVDHDALLLSEAARVLQPPDGVLLRVENRKLEVSGVAPRKWLEEARVLSRLVQGARTVDFGGVLTADVSSQLLARANEALSPPADVELALEGRRLVARGRASSEWIARARLFADAVSEIEAFEGNLLQPPDETGMILRHVRLQLRPPVGTEIRLEKGRLYLSGSAPHRWIEEATRYGPLIDGIRSVEVGDLQDEDLKRLQTVRNRLEGRVLRFERNSTNVVEGEERAMTDLFEDAKALVDSADAVGAELTLRIVGHTDDTGHPETNVKLSTSRASWVRTVLASRGIDPNRLQAIGAGAVPEAQPGSAVSGRTVTFEIVLEELKD